MMNDKIDLLPIITSKNMLASSFGRSSATTVWTMQDKRLIVFHSKDLIAWAPFTNMV